jgi:type II secretory pathway component PulF
LLQLRQEVRFLRLTVFMAVSAVLLVLMVVNIVSSIQLPRMEKIFEEMLGDRNKLPELTKLVLSYGRIAGGMLPVAVVTIVPVVACTILVMFRRSLWAVVALGFALVFLALHLGVLYLAIKSPMQTIMGPLMPSP